MFKSLLKFISSVRLAVILIAALAGLAVSATLYDLPEMYHSIPFRILVVAFFVNLLTCSVQLWPGVAKRLRRKPKDLVGQTAAFKNSTLNAQAFESALKKERFKVQRHETEEGTFFLGRQHVPALFAAHVLHVGLLIIIVGAFLSSFGVSGQLMLSPGESQPLPTAISERVGEGMITVDDFVTDYGEDGAVDNWITTFDLSLGGEQVASDATASVNHPYKEAGLSIYQMAYRNMYVVHIEGEGDITGDYAIPESQRFPLGEYTVDIEPMAEGIALLYVFDANNNEVASEAFKEGTTVSLDDGTTIEYIQPMNATVLEFKYTRAIPVIFAGFIVATLGSLLMLFGRYSEVHAFVSKTGQVSLRLLNRGSYLRRRQSKAFGIEETGKEEKS